MGLFKKKPYKMNVNDYNRLVMYDNLYMDGRTAVILGWKALKDYSGKDAVRYEKLCKENIAQFYEWIQEGERHPDFVRPIQVDAYTNLAKLYEKQARYSEAVGICSEALGEGITYDGTAGGMKKRLDRLVLKQAKNQ